MRVGGKARAVEERRRRRMGVEDNMLGIGRCC
jgi:hypothetical protein